MDTYPSHINNVSKTPIADNVADNQNEATLSEDFLTVLQQLCEGENLEQEVGNIPQEGASLLQFSDVLNAETNNFIYQNIIIAPKVQEFDVSQNTDTILLFQNTEEQKDNVKIDELIIQEPPATTEVKFPFCTVQTTQSDNQKYVQNDNPLHQIKEAIPFKNFEYNEATEYYQNDPQQADRLPFISKEVDATVSMQSDGFHHLAYEYKDNYYDADTGYQHAHASYFTQQKGSISHKMNFSLDTLENKLINQVNFTITDAIHNNNKQITVQLEPAELGKIEIIVDICNNERNITINADKISTYELLKEGKGEFLDNIKSEDAQNNVSTSLTFNYKDLSQNDSKEQLFDAQKRTEIYNNKDSDIANGLEPKKLSILFIPIDIDKQLDILV